MPNPLQAGEVTPTSLRNRFYSWQQLDRGAKAAQQHADDVMATLHRDAKEAGLHRELERLLDPPGPGGPPLPATARVKVLKAFRTIVLNRYNEHEEFAASADAVIDLPKRCCENSAMGPSRRCRPRRRWCSSQRRRVLWRPEDATTWVGCRTTSFRPR